MKRSGKQLIFKTPLGNLKFQICRTAHRVASIKWLYFISLTLIIFSIPISSSKSYPLSVFRICLFQQSVDMNKPITLTIHNFLFHLITYKFISFCTDIITGLFVIIPVMFDIISKN